MEGNFSMDQDRGPFRDDSSALYSLCTLFLLLLPHRHLRSSGITSQRLGTPVLEDARAGSWFWPSGLHTAGAQGAGAGDLATPGPERGTEAVGGFGGRDSIGGGHVVAAEGLRAVSLQGRACRLP